MHKISAPTRTLETHRDNHAGRHPHEHAHEHAHHVGRRAPGSGTGRPLPDSDAARRCAPGHLSTGSVSRTADTGGRSNTTRTLNFVGLPYNDITTIWPRYCAAHHQKISIVIDIYKTKISHRGPLVSKASSHLLSLEDAPRSLTLSNRSRSAVRD